MSASGSQATDLSVLHVAPTIGKADGISTATLNMIVAFERAGLRAPLLTAAYDAIELNSQVGQLLEATVLRARAPSPIGKYPLGFVRHLIEMASQVDLVHIHGLWRYPTLVGAPALRRARLPYVVSPHGLLMPEAVGRHAFRKSIAYRMAEMRTLRAASLVIADGIREEQALSVLDRDARYAVVPLAVDTDRFAPSVDGYISLPDRKHLLTVSRLHPIKRLVELVEAFGQVAHRHPEWDLIIAGPEDDAGYRRRIEATMVAVEVNERVQLVGRLEGEDLITRYRRADIFVLPSTSESSGLSLLEAMAVGTAVIATTGTPWSEIETEDCGWWVDPGVTALASGLDRAMSTSDDIRRAMGGRARRLALRQHSLNALRMRLLEAYGNALALWAP